MQTYIHFSNGTTTIDTDGNKSGYEYTRHDLNNILDIHLVLGSPYYVHVHIGNDYLILRHKYITFNYHNNSVQIGNKTYAMERYRGTEQTHIQQLQSLAIEMTDNGTIYGQRLPYDICITIHFNHECTIL
ncbi:hypothetical protein AHW01_15165 [Salmonella enterica subsp. enterica serovar Montevideo]|nr:hypothetical protein [Salmonella enterica subsp. enterica serovar Montevideo]